MNEHEMLNQQLASDGGERYYGNRAVEASQPSGPPREQEPPKFDFSQWQVGTNGVFRPGAKTVPKLEPAVYAVQHDQFGPYLERKSVLCDSIVDLPDSATARVLASMRKFWNSAGRYREHGLIYKRGIMLWGPPGSGKTVTIHLLMRELIAHGGLVLLCQHPEVTAILLQIMRKIEPSRPLIVVMEDIDETISSYGERSILMMLDGETQVDNVVYLATTNYPERLGARIVNRPSRFDERILIPMPSFDSRLKYLASATANALDETTLQQWAADTDQLSIAHLRELVAAVMCLDQQYPDVLERLRHMAERPRDIDGFAPKAMGLLKSARGQSSAGVNAMRGY